jgi:hypothetical protein
MKPRVATSLGLSLYGLAFCLAGGCGGAIATLDNGDGGPDDGGSTQPFDGNLAPEVYVVDVTVPPDDVYLPDTGVPDTLVVDTSIQDTSLPDTNVADVLCPAVGPGGVTTGMPACDACLGTNCCAQATSCAGDDCLFILQCVEACVADGGTTNACAPGCVNMYPSGVNDAIALQTCVQNSCAMVCM